ncbi:hypothetical protein COOONC_19108 [Cooperia oncophora]
MLKESGSDRVLMADSGRLPFNELQSKTLMLTVYDYDRLSKDDKMGELSIPLETIDFGTTTDICRYLCKPENDDDVSLLGISFAVYSFRGSRKISDYPCLLFLDEEKIFNLMKIFSNGVGLHAFYSIDLSLRYRWMRI